MKIVVKIADLGNGVTVKLESGPRKLIREAKQQTFTCPLDPLRTWTNQAPVRSYGTALLERLLQSGDPSMKDALKRILESDGGLYFQLEAASAELHSWEALCSEGFLTLDRKWSVARLVKPEEEPERVTIPFELPVRWMAVLSAPGVAAEGEWRGILQAARKCVADHALNLQLSVLFGEEKLLDAAKKEIQAKPVPNLDVTVAAAPPGSVELEREINRFKPHLLHFFCHGQVSTGVRALRIANINQWRKGEAYTLDVNRMAANPGMRTCWLVVFNACKSGLGGEELFSFTQELVAAGVPAAIGMMEEIDPVDAFEFSSHLYPAVFDQIDAVRKQLDLQPDAEVELELAKAMFEPRQAINEKRDSKPEEMRQWTVPVLYLRVGGIRMRKAAGTAPSLADSIRAGLSSYVGVAGVSSDIVESLKMAAGTE